MSFTEKSIIFCKGSQLLITLSALEQLAAYLKQRRYSRCFFLSDRSVFSLYGATLLRQLHQQHDLALDYFVIESGETAKSLANAEKCWRQMHLSKLDRASLLISMGGGVVTDLAGFAASCYMRGIDVVHLPTTLLAMVDAAIGGKTGVNLPSGKNMVGTFHQPQAVLIDPSYLSSLPKREFAAGMAEVIKYAVIKDPVLFDTLEAQMERLMQLEQGVLFRIIEASCRIKAEIVEQDEKESGVRAHLNYGHTFGHALETATNYQHYLHGEAVSIGICCAADTALMMGMVDAAFVQRQEALFERAGLPTRLKRNLNSAQLLQLMLGDKKVISGKLRLILPIGIGSVSIVDNIDPSVLQSVFEKRKE
jgi:3-dehydroquinate synthase